MRQGCPLSPLLFLLALELLAAAIRQTDQVQGIETPAGQIKIMLYANAILLMLSEPDALVPCLMSLIDDFSVFSGQRVNWSKSKALPITASPVRRVVNDYGFTWKTSKLKYLGILVNRELEDMVTDNIQPLLDKADILQGPPCNYPSEAGYN